MLKKTLLMLLIIFFSLSTVFAGASSENTSSKQASTTSALSQIQVTNISGTLLGLNTLYQYLNQNFLYDIDIDKVDEELTKALFKALNDPYSEYITEEESQEFNEDISGTYVGIGTYLTKYSPAFIDWDKKETYMVEIIAPFPGGPADRAGIRSGDLISHVNGDTVYDLTANEASKLIRGKKGEPITLTINRGNAVFDVTLYPEEVTTPNTTSLIIENTDIGYISISTFNQKTHELFSEDLKKLMNNGIKGLIIDLRNNGGGIVDSAIMIANFFLPEGETIMSIQHKEGSSKQDYSTISNNDTRKVLNLPIVILTNNGTASASEILTAALQENERATVIGSPSFGKGIIQESAVWKNGYIKFTSAYYLTPKGNNIHKKGITPDIIVEEHQYSDEEIKAYYNFVENNKDEITSYIKTHPEYTKENMDVFAAAHNNIGVSDIALKLLIRNEYIYSMPYEERPKVDTNYDNALIEAINYLQGEK